MALCVPNARGGWLQWSRAAFIDAVANRAATRRRRMDAAAAVSAPLGARHGSLQY
jgi:hypothetical protein